jgi:hypothetical protein
MESQMRPHLAVITLLAACLVTSVAYAQHDRVNVTFESFAASGVTGSATLDPLPSGEVLIHAQLKGLEPDTEYSVLIYDQSLTCGEGTSSAQIVTFKANPAGIANFNERVARELPTIDSIGIRVLSTSSLVACATVQ